MHYELYAQVRALLRALNFYFQMFSRTGVLYIVFLAFGLMLRKGGRWTTGDLLDWKLWLPAYAALGLYALVHVEPRFVSEFALMLLLALFASRANTAAGAKHFSPTSTVPPSSLLHGDVPQLDSDTRDQLSQSAYRRHSI